MDVWEEIQKPLGICDDRVMSWGQKSTTEAFLIFLNKVNYCSNYTELYFFIPAYKCSVFMQSISNQSTLLGCSNTVGGTGIAQQSPQRPIIEKGVDKFKCQDNKSLPSENSSVVAEIQSNSQSGVIWSYCFGEPVAPSVRENSGQNCEISTIHFFILSLFFPFPFKLSSPSKASLCQPLPPLSLFKSPTSAQSYYSFCVFVQHGNHWFACNSAIWTGISWVVCLLGLLWSHSCDCCHLEPCQPDSGRSSHMFVG